jgi:hypothetical protein
MSFIAFPLRLENDFLRRTGEVEAVLTLIRLMAATPGGSWSGSRNFGVRDLFEGARTNPNAARQAAERMNRALNDLYITGYRVESIMKEAPSVQDVDTYVVTLVSTVDESRTYSVALSP